MTLDHFKDKARVRVPGLRREPPGHQVDAVFLERLDLGVKRRHMLGTPIVGETPEAEPLQHLGPLLGPALAGIEWHHAPGREVLGIEEVRQAG